MDFWSPVWLSVKITAVSSVVSFVAALAAAAFMTRRRFRGKAAVETLFLLPMVLPPTVVGFLLLIVLGRRSWIGEAAEWLFQAPIVFSWSAAVIASAIVAFPLVYQSCKAGFSAIDPELLDAARSQGAGEWQVMRRITMPLSKRFLVAGFVLGFARGLGEFGATFMVAGNIPGKTQTIPTAIYIAVDAGRTAHAWGWTSIVVLLSFALVYLTNRSLR